MDFIKKLGVQSYCFREIQPLPDLIKAVRAIGVNRLELCGVHIDFQKLASHAPTVRTLQEGGLTIVSSGVNGISADEAKSRPLFEFCKTAGAKHMSISFDINELPGCLRTAEKLAEEYGMRLGIHNHGGYNWLGSIEVLRWIFKQTSPRIGLMLDTAWALHTGQSAASYVKAFGHRLWGVHLKDFSFDEKGKWHDATIGSGTLNLPELKQALIDVGFEGEPILEFEGDPRNPVPALSKCVDIIRQAFA